MTWNRAPIMTDVVKATHENLWRRQPGQDWWYGLKQDGVTLIPYSDLVTHAVREQVKEKEHDMVRGQFRVFPGMSDEDLRSMATLDSNVVSGGP